VQKFVQRFVLESKLVQKFDTQCRSRDAMRFPGLLS